MRKVKYDKLSTVVGLFDSYVMYIIEFHHAKEWTINLKMKCHPFLGYQFNKDLKHSAPNKKFSLQYPTKIRSSNEYRVNLYLISFNSASLRPDINLKKTNFLVSFTKANNIRNSKWIVKYRSFFTHLICYSISMGKNCIQNITKHKFTRFHINFFMMRITTHFIISGNPSIKEIKCTKRKE